MMDRKNKRLSLTLYESKRSDKFLEATKSNIFKMTTNVLSITSDNGTENADLFELNIPWFATNAYSSWQKGTIEQKHKQVRKFIPKGMSFKNITQEDLDLIALVINAETHLQNPFSCPLGIIITAEELKIYNELIKQKEPHRIFTLFK